MRDVKNAINEQIKKTEAELKRLRQALELVSDEPAQSGVENAAPRQKRHRRTNAEIIADKATDAVARGEFKTVDEALEAFRAQAAE